jgi:hypothetical protein
MKIPSLFTFKALAWLVALNVATTVLHYGDNILFFHEYPEPLWISPGLVDAFWFLMTPVALAGLWLARRGHRNLSSIALLTYACMSLLVLGHYRFAPLHTIGWRIHALIGLETVAALALVAWLALSIRSTRLGS